MKTIRTTDGKIELQGFTLADLTPEARRSAIDDYAVFLNEESAKGDTFEDEEVIETIEINEYLFDVQGEIIPITHYTGGHKRSGQYDIRIAGKAHPCTVS